MSLIPKYWCVCVCVLWISPLRCHVRRREAGAESPGRREHHTTTQIRTNSFTGYPRSKYLLLGHPSYMSDNEIAEEAPQPTRRQKLHTVPFYTISASCLFYIFIFHVGMVVLWI